MKSQDLDAEGWLQLNVRVDPRVARAAKVHCVEADVPLKDFVATAIMTELRRTGSRQVRALLEGR